MSIDSTLTTYTDLQVLKMEEVCELLSVSKSSIYRWIKEEGFPEPIRLGKNPRWNRSEIDDWLFYKMSKTHKPKKLNTDSLNDSIDKLAEQLFPAVEARLLAKLKTKLESKYS